MSNLDVIRHASEQQLRDRQWLEQAIFDLGIYPAQEIPQSLWKIGGIGICQHPCQFAPYLIELSRLRIRSYVEIGVWVGGTFQTTVEYLTRFELRTALAVDIAIKPEVAAYADANENATTLEAPSTSAEAARAIKAARPDLILVDGDHTEEGCRADWNLARGIARWVAIHDIVGSGFPGVVKVWDEVRGPKQEWVEQHPDTDPTAPQNGIGLVKVA